MSAVPPPPPAPEPAAGGGQGSNGLAITSLITGILSIVLCLYWFISLPLGIAGVITGVLGKKAALVKGGGGMAMAGLITGAIGVLLGVIMVVLFLIGDGLTNEWLCEYDAQYC